MTTAGHGPNIGHGFVKYVVIDNNGIELEPVIFPAMIAGAARSVAGAVVHAETVEYGGKHWWVGEDALLAPAALTFLAQERLNDAVFIPALLRDPTQRGGYRGGPQSPLIGRHPIRRRCPGDAPDRRGRPAA